LKLFTPKILIRYYSKKVLKGKYKHLREDIEKARLPVTIQEFLALSLFYAIVTFFLVLSILLLLFETFKRNFLNASENLGIKLLNFIAEFSIKAHSSLLENITIKLYSFGNLKVGLVIIFLFCILFSLFFASFVRFLILSYPEIISSKRKGEIDLYLPYAINMLHGMASGGISAYEMIKAIAEAKFMFRDLSKEFETIVKLVEKFEVDFISAMDYVRETTPSEKLSSLLEDIIFILKGGGKLSSYFSSKSKETLQQEEISYASYLEFLSLMTETYISVFILFPLFLLIILIVMKITGESLLNKYIYVLYIILPIATVFFIYILKISIPIAPAKYTKSEIKDKISVRIGKVEYHFKVKNFRRLIKKLFKTVVTSFTNEIYTVDIKIILIYIIIFSAIVGYFSYKFIPELMMPVTVSAFAIPTITFFEIRNTKIRKIEEKIPAMFKELALLNEAGLTIIESLKIVSKLDFGDLTKELCLIRKRAELGEPLTKAFFTLERRVKSEITAKIIPISAKILEVSPSFKDAFNTISQFAEAEIMLRNKIRSGMLLYVVIIYMSFFVFLIVVYILIHNMFSTLHTSSQALGISMDINIFKKIFYEVSILVSILSGLIAGVISSGRISSGFKHIYIFLMLTYIMFNYLL